MALCCGKHRSDRHRPGPAPGCPCLRCCHPPLAPGLHPPRPVPAGPQLGPCWLLPPAALWGPRCSPSGCWDPRPAPFHRAGPSGSAESVGTAASSTSSRSTGSPPAPPCPAAEEAPGPTGPAIDRRSFIGTGLAAELLEQLLSRPLPPGHDEGSPEERGWAGGTASPSLERLRRHQRGFQRPTESGREPAWAPGLPPGYPGHRWPQAQPRGHLCCDPCWPAAHGCCIHVEPVPSLGHQRGPKPSPAAPTRSEASSSRQRHRHRSCPRDTHPAPGTIGGPEPQQCRHSTHAAATEPHCEPELSRQPCGQQALAVSLWYRDGEAELWPGCGCSCGCGCGCGCGCVAALKSPVQDLAWLLQEREALVPGSCCRQARAAGAPNMVQVIARSFELRARPEPRVPPVPGPARSRGGEARARDGARS